MAILWCDGFDHYGGDVNKLADGSWAQVDSDFLLSSTEARTGTYSLRGPTSGTSNDVARRVLGGPKTAVGVGFAVFYSFLPIINDTAVMVDLRDNGNKPNISLVCQSTGDLAVFRGDPISGTKLAQTSDQPIVANAFQHVEIQSVPSATVGSVEVRVNGVARISISSINTVASASELSTFSTDADADFSQVGFPGKRFSGSLPNTGDFLIYYDDLYAYDFDGPYNNSWQGDRRVFTLFPNADTAQADWTPVGAASGFQAIDDPLSDGTYLTAGIPGSPSELRSDFDLDALPESTGLISAVELVNRVQKNEAGNADIVAGIISGANESDGEVHPLNPVFTYHSDVFQFDPASGASFTPAEINALKIKISRIT